MLHLNLLDTGGRLARLNDACERITARLDRPEMVEAVAAMRREWPRPVACDHCASPAVWTWERTAAQLKRMRGPKIRGARAEAAPVSWRCDVHRPVAFPELGNNYRDVRAVTGAARAEAVA